jgi:TolB-like protein
MFKFSKISFLLFFFTLLPLSAQAPAKPNIVIIPFQSNGLDTVYIQTAESIFRIEFSKLSKINIVSRKMTLGHLPEKYCLSVECAKEAGNKLEADQVIGCNLSVLGEKIIVQYFLLSLPEGKEMISDQTTSPTIEDLEMVMKRIAKSIAEHESLSKGAQIGNITVNESRKNMLRRASNKNIGVSFGYLYPQNGYDKIDRSLTIDLRIDYELESYSVGMLLGIRKGFAMNVYSSYLVSKKDFCPFIGGAFGFHWISHTYTYDSNGSDIKEDGFEVTARTGIIAFRTYNFQVLLNLEYIYTFNDYDDRALVFTIGIL